MIKGEGGNEFKLLIEMGLSDRKAVRRTGLLSENLLHYWESIQ